MSLIDPRGRLWGRWSVVDLLVLLFFLCLSPLVPYGLKLLRPMPPGIFGVAPARCSPGESVRITGANFRQGLRITFDGVPALSTEYYGTDMVVAYVPPDLSPGNCTVRLENLRGGAAVWEKPLELVPAGQRPQVPILLACAFINLSAAEADLLESLLKKDGAGDLSGGPRIVRLLKRGPMKTYRSRPLEDEKGKEYVIADVALLGEVTEAAGQKRYFFGNQPLVFKFHFRFSLDGHPFTAVIHREPNPDRPELRRNG